MEDKDFDEEGVRPSPLLYGCRRPSWDSLHAQQLLRDLEIVNERTRRELGPPPVKPRQVETNDVKLQHLAAVAAAAGVGITQAWSAPQQSATGEVDIPATIAEYVDEDKALLAYKSVADGYGGKTIAIVLRHPKRPDPGLEKTYEDRITYSCELVLFAEKNGELRVTGRNEAAVDCDWNDFNRRSTHLGLNEGLELSPEEVTFENENPRGGRYSYSFKLYGERWRLSGARAIFRDYDAEADSEEVVYTDRKLSYPKDFGIIAMENFDPEVVSDALYKSKSAGR